MIREELEKLLDDGAFAGCVCGTCTSEGGKERYVLGCRSAVPLQKPMTDDTLFDMASVTKVLGPAMIAVLLHHSGELDFSLRLGDVIADPGNFGDATILSLLTHSAGFLPELPLWRTAADYDDLIHQILYSQPQYQTEHDVIYSCLGFIILGYILEKLTGEDLEMLGRSLLWDRLGMRNTSYSPSPSSRFAATERKSPGSDECWCGVVHDENARFMLPRHSGNAGIFSDLGDMLRFSMFILRELRSPSMLTAEEVRLLSSDLTPFAGLSRSLGFMVNRRGYESNGGKVSGPESFGHTGFTGTSLWISPHLDTAVVLLSNRIHPSRDNMLLRQRLGSFHDAAFREMEARR